MMNVAVLLFDEFETLDVFGPVEILGRLKEKFVVRFYSLNGGLVKNSHGVNILTEPLDGFVLSDIFLIPGGYGTRIQIDNKQLIDRIKQIADASEYVLTVCTGTALLARTGLIDGLQATTNRRAFDWVMSTGTNVNWNRKARWVVDGKYYMSAGVSAGMDMTLGFVSDRFGIEFAREVAEHIEYNWREDKESE